MSGKKRAWAELNLDHLAYNVKQLKSLLAPGCALMPAVKANAYGHGALIIARALQDMGIGQLCTASVEEGIAIRKAGITGQILILGYTPPCQFEALSKYSLTQTAVDLSYAEKLRDYGKPVSVHVGIDTGMHRLGVRSENIEEIARIWTFDNLKITGLFSHLCVSDGLSCEEKKFTWEQIKKFNAVAEALRKKGIGGFKTHIQGSYGILNYPYLTFDYARPGIALYGVLSSSHDRTVSDVKLKPVLSLKAGIGCMKVLHDGEGAGYGLDYHAAGERQIAVVTIGYADGIPRALSNRGCALVHGVRVPIVGRVCMDQLLLDVSGVPGVTAGDVAVFIGKSGGEEITANELAHIAGTISNEVLSRIGSRVKRIKLD